VDAFICSIRQRVAKVEDLGMKEIRVSNIRIGPGNPLVLIAGPCVIESEAQCIDAAMYLRDLAEEVGIPLIFKSSYDKANRSSVDSYRGPGLREGLRILKRVKDELFLPVLTDVHEVNQVGPAAEAVDVLQIPAFLCRQTDLVQEVARSGKVVNVKKGQFMSPYEVANIIEKIERAGNSRIILTERGTCFGYNTLIVDMRSIPIMQNLGYPVIFDGTHSVQEPGKLGKSTGGQREFIPHLVRGAVAVGCNGIFIEVHENPVKALSDGPNMLFFEDLTKLLRKVLLIERIVQPKKTSTVL
jgi:2-dehydro-3-deoxyphosphooctonate aldolase (KDO 8-P synthase)